MGVFTAIISACQTNAAGALNRDRTVRSIDQQGATYAKWPGAYGAVGIGLDGGSNVTSDVARDTMAQTYLQWVTTDVQGTRYDGGWDFGLHEPPVLKDRFDKSAIIHTRTHAANNFIEFDYTSEVVRQHKFHSDLLPDDPANEMYYVPNLPSLTHCLFVLYAGCHSADSDGVKRPLVAATLARGAHCVAGWESGPLYLDTYLPVFWYYTMHYGSVSDADNAALAEVMLLHPDPQGTETFWSSDWNLQLRPARFGG